MKQKTHKCSCSECEIDFSIKVIKSHSGRKALPELCPFCGDDLSTDETPLLKDFDDYDEFDDEKYYDEDDDYEDDVDDSEE